jgi:hypothetical protein
MFFEYQPNLEFGKIGKEMEFLKNKLIQVSKTQLCHRRINSTKVVTLYLRRFN